MAGRAGAARRDDDLQQDAQAETARDARRQDDDEEQQAEEEQGEPAFASMQAYAMQREIGAPAEAGPLAKEAEPNPGAEPAAQPQLEAGSTTAAEPAALVDPAASGAAHPAGAVPGDAIDQARPEVAESLPAGTLGDGDVGVAATEPEAPDGGDAGQADGATKGAAPAGSEAISPEAAAGDVAPAEVAGPEVTEVADALPAPPPAPAPRAQPSGSGRHQAAAEIDAAMATERSQIEQQFASQRAAVESTAAVQEAMILGAGVGQYAATINDLGQREQSARSMFEVARNNVRMIATTQAALAQVEASTAGQRLREDATRQEQAATQSAEAEGQRMIESGKAAGRRVISSGTKTSRAVQSAVEQSVETAEHIEGAGDREAVKQALRKVRTTTRDQLLDQGLGDYDKLLARGQKNHKALLQQAGGLFKDRNQQLPELEQGATNTAAALGGRFKMMMYSQLVGIDQAERQYLAELRRIKASATEIFVASRGAGKQVRQRGLVQLATLRAREIGATAQLDSLGYQAQAALDETGELPPGQAANLGPLVLGQLAQARGAILAQAAAEGDAELGALAGSNDRFSGIVDGRRAEIGGQIDGALGQTMTAFGEAATGMASQCAIDRSLAAAMYTTTFATFSAGSWAKVEEARADWKQQADSFQTSVDAGAEASVARHAQLVEAMPAKLDGISKSTIEERGKSWLRRTLEGAWSGFKSFVKWAVIAIVVIWVVVALGAPLLVVLAIAALVALGISLYQRFNALFDAWGDWPWYAKVAGVVGTVFASVGDLIGLTGMLEGAFSTEAVTGRDLSTEEAAERFTVGALTLLTLGLIRAYRGKAPGAGRPPAGELPPGEAPAGGKPPAVEPPVGESSTVRPPAEPIVEGAVEKPPVNESPLEKPPASERANEPSAKPSETRMTYEERLAELSKDPDHGGSVTDGSAREAKVAIDLEAQGKLQAPVRRPVKGDGHSGDFVDGKGGDWDVKAPRSRAKIIEKRRAEAEATGRKPPSSDRPIKGEYETGATIKEIKVELRAGEKVIIDTEGMTADDLQALKDAVKADPALEGNVIFHE